MEMMNLWKKSGCGETKAEVAEFRQAAEYLKVALGRIALESKRETGRSETLSPRSHTIKQDTK